jgi:2-haloacid dehalogenase
VAIDFGRFEALTFDCYGTMIDWERGILNALQPILAPRGVLASEQELLELFAEQESGLEAGGYLSYREVLAQSLRGICQHFGFRPTTQEEAEFSLAVGNWPAFPDSAPALGRLATRFRLGVITNCDDDLFALSNRRLGVSFEWIITAQQARSYKPSLKNFELAFATIDVPRERILHVAQSLFHDHIPALNLGMTTAWIDRRQGKVGFGATPVASATPSLVLTDLASLAEIALG